MVRFDTLDSSASFVATCPKIVRLFSRHRESFYYNLGGISVKEQQYPAKKLLFYIEDSHRRRLPSTFSSFYTVCYTQEFYLYSGHDHICFFPKIFDS